MNLTYHAFSLCFPSSLELCSKVPLFQEEAPTMIVIHYQVNMYSY